MGFGTYAVDDPQVIVDAVEMGYRHLDTAHMYKNEEVVGEAI